MADNARRLDRQEMEQRSRLLMELHEDAARRFIQYGSNRALAFPLGEVVIWAKRAALEANRELEAYREEWERVK
jgi:hypothetical protein